MNILIPSVNRRRFLHGLGLGAAAFATPGLFAEALGLTPAQTEGPFYPDHLPLDTDNDLIVVNNDLTPGVGTISYVSGRVLDAHGAPVRNALVEIWQADNNGVYLHTQSEKGAHRDQHFQGFGRFLTGASGEYLFRTIKPVPYAPRTPHIHFKVKRGGKELLTTQCYIKGHPLNATDGVLKDLKDAKQRALLMVDFKPLPKARAGELAGKFDIVLGVTPEG